MERCDLGVRLQQQFHHSGRHPFITEMATAGALGDSEHELVFLGLAQLVGQGAGALEGGAGGGADGGDVGRV